MAVYLALPPGDAPGIIHAASVPGGSVLELGSGAGRTTRPLVGLGHEVVAIDDSLEMLEHVTGARRVCADLFSLALRRRFDTVVAASHLIDSADRALRQSLLDVCRRHVALDGVVLIERHEPDWARDPVDSEGSQGPVHIAFRVIEHRDTEFDAAVTYTVGERSWTQTFSAAVIEDEGLEAEAGAAGLELERWLDERRTWARLTPTRIDAG